MYLAFYLNCKVRCFDVIHPLLHGGVFLQYRISAVSKVGANQLSFPDQESGTDVCVATYFGQKYFQLTVSFDWLIRFEVGWLDRQSAGWFGRAVGARDSSGRSISCSR